MADQSRINAGVPTGGQFATQSRDAADLSEMDLSDPWGPPEAVVDGNLDEHPVNALVADLRAAVQADADRFGEKDPYSWGGISDRLGETQAAEMYAKHKGELNSAFDEIYTAEASAELDRRIEGEKTSPIMSADANWSWNSITAEVGRDRAVELFNEHSGNNEAARSELDRGKTAAPPADRPWQPGKKAIVDDGQYRTVTGAKFDDQWHSAADVARNVRADLKAAVAAGEFPPGVTFSVRSESYAGGQSVRAEIRGLTNAQIFDPELDDDRHGSARYSAETREMLAKLESYVDAYNKTTSDPYTDYHDNRYFGFANVETERGAEWRAKEKELADLQKQWAKANLAGGGPELHRVVTAYREVKNRPYVSER